MRADTGRSGSTNVKRLLIFLLALGISWSVEAQWPPATHLLLSNNPCLIQICPPVNVGPTATVAAGVPFRIFGAAQSARSGRAAGYTGTVFFSSSDPLATLPGSYTFVLADEGGREFSAILRTPGMQTITVRDSLGNLLPGTLVMTVTGPGAPAIPTISRGGAIMLVVGFALFGLILLRLRP